MYILSEMDEYPIEEDNLDENVVFPFSNAAKNKTNNTFSELLLNLGSNLNYLDL